MSPVRQVEHEVTSVYQQEGQLLADEVVAFAISRKIHPQALLSSICRVVSSHANKHGLVEGASAHHFREARRCAPTQTTTELVRRQSASSQNCILLLYIYIYILYNLYDVGNKSLSCFKASSLKFSRGGSQG